MSKPIRQAIGNLIPRHSGALPPELVDLASSLLAQSHSQISNLKSEEEIARTYACANIACERLKTTLNLPNIEPRPPIPPHAYSKLYGHFDKTLASSASRKRARQNEQRSEKERILPERHAPSKEKSFRGFRASRTPKHGLKYGGMNKDARLPTWVGPAIRKLCKELDAGKAVPHVYAGVESIMFLPCPKEEVQAERMEGKLPALIAATLFYVMIKMAGKKTTPKEFNAQRTMVLRILEEMKGDETIIRMVGLSEDGWKGWEVVDKSHVEAWMKELSGNAWLKMEWYENLKDGMGVSGDDEESEDDEEVEELERARKKKREWGQDLGRGTMKQDQFNYLSEEKRKEFAIWKVKVLGICKELIDKSF